MKKMLMTLFALTAILSVKEARASVDVNVIGSSWTWSGVVCTSGTAGRIDNYSDIVVTGTVSEGRIGVEFQNQDSTSTAYIAFNINVSSANTTAGQRNRLGFKLKAGDVKFYGAKRLVQIWCLAEDRAGAGGINLHTETAYKE